MSFGKKLKALRESHGYTQMDIAKAAEVTDRAVGKWEREESSPTLTAAAKAAKFLGVPLDVLIDEEDAFIMKAEESYGAKGKKQAQKLIEEAKGIFYGGHISQDDMDLFYQTMMEMYFDAKQKNKKYSSKNRV